MKNLQLPDALLASVDTYLERFQERASPDDKRWLDQQLADETFARQLRWVWAGSEFVALSCIQFPELLRSLVESGELLTSRHDKALPATLLAYESEALLQSGLRKFRRRQMLRIIWRDLTRQADTMETTGDMSWLADVSIKAAIAFLYPMLAERWGTPIGGESGQRQQLVVLGMGKLGAGELNVSSDIDLIFTYPEAGDTQGGRSQCTNQEFFIRLGQKLVQALDNKTVDGFVFRVDMRLRPYGESGTLVLNFAAMEEYYQAQGRDWERYAMIKCRAITGDEAAQAELMAILRPFTYRRYIDFGAIAALRDMKTMITREVLRRGLGNDIKLGPGGIREIEFTAQAFQLIRGGRDLHFQTQSLRQVLRLIDEEKLLPDGSGEQLWQGYCFLRDVEHVIQAWRDQQTQQLPDGDLEHLRMATMMGFVDWASFMLELDRHRDFVRGVFSGFGEDADDSRGVESAEAWQLDESEQSATRLAELGFDDAERAAQTLQKLVASSAVQAMPTDTRTRLDALLPLLINSCVKVDNATETLQRVLVLVEGVARRSAYLVLLIESPAALEQLVKLCAVSPWIAESVARNPALLDELLDARSLYAPPARQQLADELRQLLLRIPDEDLEAQMETLRYFRLAHGLRVAACEVMGLLPLMRVSDYLTWLAEVILEQVLAIAWRDMTGRYGLPCNANGRVPGLLIVGYGKLGGIELGHGSDLDMVFIHNATQGLHTDGERSVDNETFFARLGQRILHILGTRMASGVLYETDMRLRPSGNSGLLVCSLDAFAKYQHKSAWTWEQQALVRARGIAGDHGLAEQFEALRRQLLERARDPKTLRAEVAAMRDKMFGHLGSGIGARARGEFNLKQDRGGIVDIEFMVQFAVLAQSNIVPAVAHWQDNIRILGDLVAAGFFSTEEGEQLTQAYIAYRSAGHRLQLQQLPGVVKTGEFDTHRRAVATIWARLFDSDELA
ncbi:MAG: bifunctional [glutamate--ammonia ligase]-adenylyl-L-tyrosine phosphorylase/[glutamate--ammonia-ligase] adenylyltransferase [Gammaproteobacteria bacterium]|nr:bifunctional [glutamate--ammonia ligase]-adenylyl-L-tyrosine phosphorylase/[glutamate--ammonia-ligase] adenylyltransferase [Gammaproteobacteria bacterium]MBQ0841203.1 bifunctional [glutamate--ammonia ligase]-adenylyl-L-tyrosine phosphorylase/[glutamate--ammonia-ligase] adenylyltransferase [Gammaproteobacteria bacterium]